MPQINQRQMLPMGTVLDRRYRIIRYLASGGFGNTYVAEHILLGDQVAIKEFFMRGTNHRSPDGTTVEVSNEENTVVFNAQLNKFRREAQRICRLHNDHIIHVSDLFDANGTSYYVMDLITGSSLAEQTRQQPLSEHEAHDVALQVLDALETMHNAGLYHLDVKPGNIMRDSRGHCTLIDFGASKQLTADERATLSSSAMAYTPGYAPLEQVAQQSENIGPWTDFFALGATLYRLLTGTTPPAVAINDFAPDGRRFSYPVPVSDTMRHAISTLMNPIHDLRPQTTAEVKALLEEPVQSEKNELPGGVPSEETVKNDPTPVPTNEQTNYTSSPKPSPQPISTPPSSSPNIPPPPNSSQDIPNDSNLDNQPSRKWLWPILGAVALILGSLFLSKNCGKESQGNDTDDIVMCPDDNHPHMIDLGLPSGTKWACCNVDAKTPEDYGGYYAWGETTTKNEYTMKTYEHSDATGTECISIGNIISGTQYDVAHVKLKWGSSWQMPTYDQIKELLDNCEHEWITVNGVKGRKFTGPNGGSIFLPAAGNRWDTGLNNVGFYGYYWSSAQNPSYSRSAYSLYFNSDYAGWSYYGYRSSGLSVRPVAR